MKRDNLWLIGLLIVIVVMALVCAFFAFRESQAKVEQTDAIKMQEEYASLNGKENANHQAYKTVNLDDGNPYVYQTENEVIDLLTNGSGVIYFGYKSCPWCRQMVSVLADAAKEMNVTTIYYLDIENIRSVFALDENNKLITEREGSADYYKILELLDDVLEEYTLTGEDGQIIETGEKRLYAPTVVSVLDGIVTDIHVGTVDTQEDPYTNLSEQELQTLKETYKELISQSLAPVCTDAC